MELTDEVKKLLYYRGADLIGIGDMSEVENCHFKTGISIAVALPKNTIIDLQKAPTKEYYDLYYSLNKKLNEIVMAGEDFLKKRGFEAYAPLKYDEPVNQSYCGTCNQCVKNCPAQALKQIYAENVLRFVHIPKDICKIELYNFFTFYMKILFQITNVIKRILMMLICMLLLWLQFCIYLKLITYIWHGFHSSHNVGNTSNSLKPRER